MQRLLIITLFLLAPFSFAQDESGDAEKLQTLLSSLNTLKGNFEQSLEDFDGELVQKSDGKFAVQRPGKFLWHTNAPFEQVLITDEKTLWLYDPDLEQVTIRDYDARLQQTPLIILSGDPATLNKHFSIQALDNNTDEQAFSLIPREADTVFASLELVFVAGQVSAMTLIDSLGQTTRVRFSNLQVNPVLDPTTFAFEPPPGVDIIRDE